MMGNFGDRGGGGWTWVDVGGGGGGGEVDGHFTAGAVNDRY